MPNAEGQAIIRRRHAEWQEFKRSWSWLLDSLEGGDRYRFAEYGQDSWGLPIRNLVRHKREYPQDPRNSDSLAITQARAGQDPSATATNSDYDLRLARTPVPTFFTEAVHDHLTQIYSREVRRQGPDDLAEWWLDVDGRGTEIGDWMLDTLGPHLLSCGQVDVFVDHPDPPHGMAPSSEADVRKYGLNRAVVSLVRPENVLWWTLLPNGCYKNVLILEKHCNDEGKPRNFFRLWTETDWTLYDDDGELVDQDSHRYGRVPIVRIFDLRKSRCDHVGQSRYAGVAERMREFYNRDSELILSDTTQAHPLLQGPEDYVNPDGSIPIGPSWLLPKKKNVGSGMPSYEGFEVVQFPKDGADSIRKNKADIRADIDRDVKRVQNAGEATTSSGHVEQSGISKSIDRKPTHDLLCKIAKTLKRAETAVARLVLDVLSNGGKSSVKFEIVYPESFELYSASDAAIATSDFFNLVTQSGNLPGCESYMLKRCFRLSMPGLSEDQYSQCDTEIDSFVNSGGWIGKQQERQQAVAELEAKLVPAGHVRDGVKDPAQAKQKPGDTPSKVQNE